MPINVSLFGHILLDAELNGRFGVQGNTFRNTFAYLNEWLKQHINKPTTVLNEANKEQLNHLSQSMQQLCQEEASILKLNDPSDKNSQKLNAYTAAIAQKIEQLAVGKTLMLPGGWGNKRGYGHAMLYEFKKNDEGSINFSIYNSGAGISLHDKKEDGKSTRFSPVKTYRLESQKIDQLVKELILPQVPHHPERNELWKLSQSEQNKRVEHYNEEILYSKIKNGLLHIFKHSTRTYSEKNSTASQISGTCAQRSIHQMIKVQFDTLPNYQRFILDFKMHALREFIAEHPAPPRSEEINEFIILGIENNLKILQEPNLFAPSEPTKQNLLDELIRLKSECTQSIKAQNQQSFLPRSAHNHTTYSLPSSDFNPSPISEQAPSFIHQGVNPEITNIDIQSKLDINELQTILNNCSQRCQTHPHWVVKQIEQIINHLPLPHDDSALNEVLPFYADIKKKNQFNALIGILEQLSQTHQNATKACLGDKITPSTMITHTSFIALYQYLDIQNASLNNLASFEAPIQCVLSTLLNTLQLMPHIASKNPAFDQRLRQLEQLHNKTKHINISLMDKYQALLNLHPELKQRLQNAYNEMSEKPDTDTCILLKANNTEALYYLFTQLDEKGNKREDSTLDSEIFKPLLNSFKQAINFEQTVSKHASTFFDNKLTPFKIIRNSLTNELVFKSPFSSILQLRDFFQIDLSPNKFNQLFLNKSEDQTSSILQTLMPNHVERQFTDPFNKVNPHWKSFTENEIQLTQKDLFTRDLYQLRISKHNQIQSTLDYFISSIDKLSEPDIQQYITLNIFEPGLLCELLKTNRSTFLEQFDIFIEKGLKQALDKKGNLSKTSLYFMKLSLSVNCYMADYDQTKSEKVIQRIEKDYQRLNQALQITTAPSLVDNLHSQRFMALMTLQKKNGPITSSQFTECWISFFHVQNRLAEKTHNIAEEFELQNLAHEFEKLQNSYLTHNSNELITAIKAQTCKRLNITNPSDFNLTGEYPSYTLRRSDNSPTFTINALTGYVFNENNQRLSALPLELQSHRQLKRLNIAPDMQWSISMDNLTLTSQDGNIRLKRDPTSKSDLISIQKKWTINRTPESWYELQTSKAEQSLPASLIDANCASWANKDNAFITQDNQPRYSQTQAGIAQLDDKAMANGLYLNTWSQAHEALYSFESSSFLHVNLSHDKKTGSVELPRYGLSFTIKGDALQLNNTPYTLTTPAASPFKPEVAFMTCVDAQQHQHCVVPVQRFYVDKKQQTKGHQYKLTHDINAVIETDMLKNQTDSPRSYLKSEVTITFPLIDGKPQPNNAGDALYLAYIYLATHEHEKAWDVLNTISKRFPLKGTEQELTYLSWIINALPYQVGDSKDKEQELGSPRDVACQLKAMSLYTIFLSEGKKTLLPQPEDIDTTTVNAICRKKNLIEINDFRDQLYKSIEQKYSKLIRMKRHLHSKYTLNDEESSSLLSYWSTQWTKEKLASDRESNDQIIQEPNVELMGEHEHLNNQKRLAEEKTKGKSHQYQITLEPIHSNQLLCLRDVISKAIEIDTTLLDNEKIQLNEKMNKFYQAETNYQAIFYQSNLPSELQAGEALHARTMTQRQIASNTLSDKKVRDRLLQHANTHKNALTEKVDNRWEAILILANEELNTTLKVKVAAGQCHLLTKRDLLAAYVHEDSENYKNLSHLSPEKILQLHNMIHQCMLLEIEKQHATRLADALDKAAVNATEIQLANIASILTSQHLPKAQDDPKLIFFQYEENILLRPRQLEAVNNLLNEKEGQQGYNESIEKVIMGGGKSKVILPLLAQKKADGTNLVIIEVPRPLLATNHMDLLRTSQRLFGQNVLCFEFDRSSDCSAQRLEEIYHQFCDISSGKNYLVTTGEAMQSLELKYLELLLSKPSSTEPQDIETWEAQVHWASKITDLLKQRGDVVIDEVHQGLLLKKKLNYTLGTPLPIEQSLITQTLDLYQFLHDKALYADFNSDNLLTQLLEDPSSPLKEALMPLFNIANPNIMLELRGYLNNEKQPVWLEALDPKLKNSLAFYKEQLQLLPQTLNRHYKEHYGPSQKDNTPVFRRALAIPYSANDKPNERSQFGNPLETLNYTVQALFKEGLNQALLSHMVEQWQNEARFELQHGVFENIDATPTGCKIKILLKKTSFNSLHAMDHNNQEQMFELLNQVQHEPLILRHALEHMILPEITREPATLHSDPLNHVELYRSTQGLSGTPSNHSTFHQRLQFNATTSLGSDGYIQTVLKKKNTPIRGVKFEQLNTYFEALLTSKSTHAIIDINATFVGLSNLSVTHALATHLKSHNDAIKYILYFEEDAEGNDVLHAYSINEKKSIVLTSSDPNDINQQLNCQPEQRFTYYDQAHTVGVDLKQAHNGSALCLIDEETSLQNFLQGVMRMRGLDEQQSIQLIVPEAMSNQSLDQLLSSMQDNETNQLAQDNFYATLAKLHNIIRRQALSYLAKVSDIETKHQYADAFRNFIIETHTQDLFDEYGAIYQVQNTEELLQNHIISLISKWTNKLEKLQVTDNINTLEAELQDIARQALPLCPTKFKSPLHHQQNTEVEVQREVMNEKETKKEVQKLVENIMEPGKLKPCYAHNKWTDAETRDITFNGFNQHPLNNWCPQPNSTNLFSSELKASSRYIETYEGQEEKQAIGAYLKPVHYILYRMDSDNNLSACLISNEEANELRECLNGANKSELIKPALWLETTNHTCLAGNRPDAAIIQANYHILMEQTRYFNGQFTELLEQTAPYLWLDQQPKEKLDKFETLLMPYRGTTQTQVSLLNQVLTQPPTQGLEYIKEHAFEDLTTIDWQKKYPKALPFEVATLRNLASAISQANQTAHSTSEKSELTQLLPNSAKLIFNEHSKQLDNIRIWLKRIETNAPNQALLSELTPDEQKQLEVFLHTNLDMLKTMYSITENKAVKTNAQCLNLHLLLLLIESPNIDETSFLKARVNQQLIQMEDSLTQLSLHKSLLPILLMNDELSEQEILKVIEQINLEKAHPNTLELIINHPNTPESTFFQLLEQAPLTPLQINHIAKRSQANTTLNLLIEKYPPTLEQAPTLLKKDSSLNLRSHFINGCKTDNDFKQIEPHLSNFTSKEVDILLKSKLSFNSIDSLIAKTSEPGTKQKIQAHKLTLQNEYAKYKADVENNNDFNSDNYRELIQNPWFTQYRSECSAEKTFDFAQKKIILQYAEPPLTLDEANTLCGTSFFKLSIRGASHNVTLNQCKVLAQIQDGKFLEKLMAKDQVLAFIFNNQETANYLLNNPQITKDDVLSLIQDANVTPEFVLLCINSALFANDNEIQQAIREHSKPNIQALSSQLPRLSSPKSPEFVSTDTQARLRKQLQERRNQDTPNSPNTRTYK